ncbi:hypothetical protein DUI87_14273 [Hirundo rustica rustica]|uniref:Uncharacterized protein n=1 Tax=Hirundo rustica rustica TaxID=333673 RepID=A0A3M0K837_HIRRU|nr:hypothetical protein DUI87_14273 [Hirundo rustica rustica]
MSFLFSRTSPSGTFFFSLGTELQLSLGIWQRQIALPDFCNQKELHCQSRVGDKATFNHAAQFNPKKYCIKEAGDRSRPNPLYISGIYVLMAIKPWIRVLLMQEESEGAAE